MAATVADKVILPLDTGNTGKKVRTQTRTVGADTVHEHFFVPSSTREYKGVYGYHGGNQLIQASAQNGTSTGFWWFINPIGSTVKVGVERIRYCHSITTTLSTPTCPRVVIQLFTFTGTASGAAVTPGKFNSGYPAAQGSMRTAVTGLTVSLGGIIDATVPIVSIGTTGWAVVSPQFDDNIAISELSDIVLLPGEGIVCYQPDAGTAADTRRLIADIVTAEFE